MGQIRHINGVYYIEFHARGLLYSQIAGNDPKEAARLLQEIEVKIAGGEALTIVRHIQLADFFERFLEQAKEYYTPKSVSRFIGLIAHFNGFIRDHFPHVHQLDQLTPVILESYKVDLAKKQKIKIVNLTVLMVRDVLEYGIKLGFLNDNPSLHVRLLPWPAARRRKSTPRFQLAARLLPRGLGLGKFAEILKLPDIARGIYFAALIPLCREGLEDE